MLRSALIYLSQSKTAKAVVRSAPGARQMARRFTAGETIDDGIRACRELNKLGMTTSLDYLGESVHNREEAIAAADTYIAMMDRLVVEKINGNISVKLTQMGQDIDEAFLRENVLRLLNRAREHDMFVRFDMESSAYTERTLRFVRGLWHEGYKHIGVVIQSYLRRSVGDVEQLNADQMRVRLCKGAYKEPESVAYQDKRDVDDNYVKLMQLLLKHGNYPGIATHDEAIIQATRTFARQQGIDPSRFEFQMLYGIRRDLQQQLIKQGYNMRVYVPCGEAWYPYLMRRMAERPANMFFFVGNVVKEPLRRLTRRNSK